MVTAPAGCGRLKSGALGLWPGDGLRRPVWVARWSPQGDHWRESPGESEFTRQYTAPAPASRVYPASFRSPELQLRVKERVKAGRQAHMTHFRLPMVARHEATRKAFAMRYQASSTYEEATLVVRQCHITSFRRSVATEESSEAPFGLDSSSLRSSE